MRTGERGFGYVFLLVLVAILGYASAHAIAVGESISHRQAEQELLQVGREFEAALYSYSGMRAPQQDTSLPVGVLGATGPRQLSELLKDQRLPGIRRHLRKIYADPVSGQAEWGVIRDQAGRIVGIHSLSTRAPIKTDGFDAAHTHFANASSYRDWIFGFPISQVQGRKTSPADEERVRESAITLEPSRVQRPKP